MHRSTLTVLAFVAVTAFLVGCEPPQSTAPPKGSSDATVSDGSKTKEAAPVNVRIVDRPGYEQVVQGHHGHVVLVDFWATWCEPCKLQFPHTVKLSREYSAKGLAVVSLSMDDPANEDVRIFLGQQDASTLDNLVSKFGTSTRSAEEFEFPGGVPFYRLYDRNGQLRYQFCADHEGLELGEPIEQIDTRVAELLAEK